MVGRSLVPAPTVNPDQLEIAAVDLCLSANEHAKPRLTRLPPTLWSSVERAFQTKPLPPNRDAVAPDGSDVRILLQVGGGGLAHFELAARHTSVAIRHRSVEEIWYFLSGRGEMWRKSGDDEEVVAVSSGVCITIPLGTAFQFRASGEESLAAIGATIPPWPGSGEAAIASGPWEPTIEPGPI
jgi:mannose-6-phosphate isomerase-like protein (cupin superfamily)